MFTACIDSLTTALGLELRFEQYFPLKKENTLKKGNVDCPTRECFISYE
jgi:hypothetical protein